MLQIYKSIILPTLTYAIVVWGPFNPTKLNRLHILQKKALRIICKVSFLYPSLPLFLQTNTLNIFYLYEKHMAILIFQFHNKQLPITFDTIFRTIKDTHNYGTRNRTNYTTVLMKTKMGQNSISYRGAKIWNGLEHNIRNIQSISLFKKEMHKKLLNKYK